VGNDFHHGSLPFYLSKPIGTWHYLLGKMLSAGGLIHLLTTLPALALYLQAGLLYDWQSYYLDNFPQLIGILAYGLVLHITLSLLLVTTAIWVRRTVPLVMIWSGLFVLCRSLGGFLVDGLNFHPRWRLIDLWNDMYLVGLWCLQAERKTEMLGNQPEIWLAGLVLVALCGGCLLFLRNRVQAVDIVT
jgi:hypothetical protein